MENHIDVRYIKYYCRNYYKDIVDVSIALVYEDTLLQDT